jgi:hypothetical protein
MTRKNTNYYAWVFGAMLKVYIIKDMMAVKYAGSYHYLEDGHELHTVDDVKERYPEYLV